MSGARPGPRNLLTDVEGLRVGNAEDAGARTGTTVVLAEGLVRGGVDVRGGGPGTREVDVLSPENLVGGAHAVVLSGGSVHGLAAADAVTAALAARGEGLRVHPGHPPAPIVPGAILYDLTERSEAAFAGGAPYARLGREALEAVGDRFALGSAGAGRGANCGTMKGGLGSASLRVPGPAEDGGEVTVAALVAANPVGGVTLPGSRVFWAWPFEQQVDGAWEFGGLRPDPGWAPVSDPFPPDSRLAGRLPPPPGAATAIGVAATDADLTTAECRRLAIMAQDGLARAIRPAHTPMDGDTIFVLATGRRPLGQGPGRALRLAALGSAAADCVARSVARAAYLAVSEAGERPAWRDLG